MARLNSQGKHLFAQASYQEAREVFLAAAIVASRNGDPGRAAMNWNNAGGCSVATMQFRAAMNDFSLARRTAESTHRLVPLIYTLNNLTSLYLHMGQPENAIEVAREALAGPTGFADRSMRAKLLCQLGSALKRDEPVR